MATSTSQPKPVKICTLGESGAGKSSLIMRLTTGNFSANQVRARRRRRADSLARSLAAR